MCVLILGYTYTINLLKGKLMENNQLTIIDVDATYSLSVKKPEKVGSLSMLIAFGDSTSRKGVAEDCLKRQYLSGTYRPVLRDLGNNLLNSKTIVFFPEITESGALNKTRFIDACKRLYNALNNGKELKGKKAFYFGFLKHVVETATVRETVLEA